MPEIRERSSIQYSSYFVVLQNAWENCKIPFKNFFYNAKHVHMCVTFWHLAEFVPLHDLNIIFKPLQNNQEHVQRTWENSKLIYYFRLIYWKKGSKLHLSWQNIERNKLWNEPDIYILSNRAWKIQLVAFGCKFTYVAVEDSSITTREVLILNISDYCILKGSTPYIMRIT